MRAELKLGNKNVLVVFARICDGLWVRLPGAKNKDNIEKLISIDWSGNRIVLNKKIADKFGIKIVVEGGN